MSDYSKGTSFDPKKGLIFKISLPDIFLMQHEDFRVRSSGTLDAKKMKKLSF